MLFVVPSDCERIRLGIARSHTAASRMSLWLCDFCVRRRGGDDGDDAASSFVFDIVGADIVHVAVGFSTTDGAATMAADERAEAQASLEKLPVVFVDTRK
jgi:hypothetical protein